MERNISEELVKPLSPDGYLLNIAATCRATRALGPGLRAAVWVQGCPFRCPGCIAPGWVPFQPGRLVEPDVLVDELLAQPGVTGLTFSGGEPMVQAAALARLARLVRASCNIDIICFTGFLRRQLETNPPYAGVHELLDQVDVLIDGPYIARLNDNQGLRGSSNQRIHYLTNRLAGCDLDHLPRSAEIHVTDGEAMLVGVPPARLETAFNQAVSQAQQMAARAAERGLPGYERI